MNSDEMTVQLFLVLKELVTSNAHSVYRLIMLFMPEGINSLRLWNRPLLI